MKFTLYKTISCTVGVLGLVEGFYINFVSLDDCTFSS